MSALPIAGLHPRTAASPWLNWRRASGYGVLWAIACTAMESFALPLGALSLTDLLEFNLRVVTQWTATGIVLASALLLYGPRLTPALSALALLAFAVAASGTWAITYKLLFTPTWTASGNYAHTFWGSLCYSGVFVAVYQMSQRAERTRALLAQAEIARQRSEAALSAAQLRALQGQVDPAFLLRVMVEIERRYTLAPATVDGLLDPLIGFLRAAMPGVRSGASTLAAEVLLALQYTRLVATFDPGRTVRAIRVDGPMPDLPFPPLLLLPVLDALAAMPMTTPSDAGTTLRVSQRDGRCTLTLDRSGLVDASAWLPPELLYRLQVGLRTLFGDAWTLSLHTGPGTPAITLTLPGLAPATPTRADATRPHHLETTHHG